MINNNNKNKKKKFQGGALIPTALPHPVKIEPCAAFASPIAPLFLSCACKAGNDLDPAAPATSDGSSCKRCALGYYKPDIGDFPCSACPTNMDTGGITGAVNKTQCTCARGFYRQAKDIKAGSFVCRPCEPGGSCPGEDVIYPAPEYWSAIDDPYTFYKCRVGQECLGGTQSALLASSSLSAVDTCKEGSEGPLCGVCSEGYGKFGDSCQPCPKTGATYAYLAFTILFTVFMVFRVTRAGQKDVDPESPLTKSLMNFLQMLGLLKDVQVQFPTLLSTAMGFAGSSSSFALRGWSSQCGISRNYFTQFYVHLIIPLIMWGFVLAIYGIARLVIKRKINLDDDARAALVYKTNSWGIVGAIAVVLYMHPTIAKECLQVFDCVTLGTKSYVSVDLAQQCGTGAHNTARVVASFMLLFFTFGLPAAGIVFMYMNRARLEDPVWAKRYQVLFGGYNRNRFFWEGIVILRKLLIVFFLVFLKPYPAQQMVVLLLTLFFSLLLHFFGKAYQGFYARLMEFVALLVVFLALVLNLSFSSTRTKPGDVIVAIIILVGIVATVAIFIALIILTKSIALARKRKAAALLKAANGGKAAGDDLTAAEPPPKPKKRGRFGRNRTSPDPASTETPQGADAGLAPVPGLASKRGQAGSTPSLVSKPGTPGAAQAEAPPHEEARERRGLVKLPALIKAPGGGGGGGSSSALHEPPPEPRPALPTLVPVVDAARAAQMAQAAKESEVRYKEANREAEEAAKQLALLNVKRRTLEQEAATMTDSGSAAARAKLADAVREAEAAFTRAHAEAEVRARELAVRRVHEREALGDTLAARLHHHRTRQAEPGEASTAAAAAGGAEGGGDLDDPEHGRLVALPPMGHHNKPKRQPPQLDPATLYQTERALATAAAQVKLAEAGLDQYRSSRGGAVGVTATAVGSPLSSPSSELEPPRLLNDPPARSEPHSDVGEQASAQDPIAVAERVLEAAKLQQEAAQATLNMAKAKEEDSLASRVMRNKAKRKPPPKMSVPDSVEASLNSLIPEHRSDINNNNGDELAQDAAGNKEKPALLPKPAALEKGRASARFAEPERPASDRGAIKDRLAQFSAFASSRPAKPAKPSKPALPRLDLQDAWGNNSEGKDKERGDDGHDGEEGFARGKGLLRDDAFVSTTRLLSHRHNDELHSVIDSHFPDPPPFESRARIDPQLESVIDQIFPHDADANQQ